MVASKRKVVSTPKQEINNSKAKELDTTREINKVLDRSQVDLAQLRKLAAARGLVNSEIRARVWPLLLGLDRSEDTFDDHKAGRHRDSSVVEVDVQRSLWSFSEGWSDDQRDVKRKELRHVLDAAVCSHNGSVFYYQGLHDIASVLLFVMGERAACQTLSHLTCCQLRDCTRSTLDAVLELLGLLMPILEEADAEVHRHLAKAEVPPYFALSWLITWFAHSVDDLQQISRLFDLFMASHPLMPLYVAALVIKGARKEVLACEADPAELHRLLTNLPVLGHLTADELCCQASSLLRQYPPSKLAANAKLHFICSTSTTSELRNQHWHVANEAAAKGTVPHRRLSFWKELFTGPGTRQRAAVVGLASLSLGLAAFALSQNQLATQLLNMTL